MIEDAIRIGKKLADYHLIDGASGNLSFRNGEKIVITRTGAVLDSLTEDDFISVEIGGHDERASSDFKVHEKIYRATDYRVVLHCHGVYNVALSLIEDRVIPIDLEGKLFLKEIRFIEGEFGSNELAEKIADGIKEKGFAVVKAHGIYTAADNFDNAFKIASYVEHSCHVLYLFRLLTKL